MQCYDLDVPANRQTGSTARVSVHAARFLPRGADPGAPPLYTVLGGPGQSWTDGNAGARFAERIEPSEVDALGREVVLLEQRGTGESLPVTRCDAVSGFQVLSAADAAADAATQLADCRQTLRAAGVDVAGFNVVELAEDVEALRQSLGHGRIFLAGTSYGTRISLEYLRRHADALAGVILDSVLPPERPALAHGARDVWRSFEAIFDACGLDADCNAAFPNAKSGFLTLLNELEGVPIVLGSTGVQIGPRELLMLLIFGFSSRPGDIPAAVNAVRNPALRLALLAPRTALVAAGAMGRALEETVLAKGMFHSITCADNTGLDQGAIDAQMPDLPNVSAARSAARFSLDLVAGICGSWGAQALAPETLAPVVNSDVPVLMVQGSFDTLTPAVWAQSAAAGLARSQRVALAGAGHSPIGLIVDGGGRVSCPKQLARAFLRDPGTSVDATCAAAITPSFATNVDLLGALSQL
ncbi:MAG: alpha/beta fold hydrolase [Polyangiales bacterium]